MLTPDEAVQLIAVIAVYDSRQPDPSRAEVAKWVMASRHASPPWPSYAAVEEAVHRHYANRTYPIMPGHVTEMLAEAAAERRQLDGGHPSARPYAELALESADRPGPSPEPSPARAAAMREIAEALARKKSVPRD